MEAQVREISRCYALALKLENSPKSMTEAASRSWTRQGKRFSSNTFRMKAALPTSWFLSQWDLFHGPVRQWICVVLSDPVGGNLLQQQQRERNTVCSHERSSQRENWTKFPRGMQIVRRGGGVSHWLGNNWGEERHLEPVAWSSLCNGGPQKPLPSWEKLLSS